MTYGNVFVISCLYIFSSFQFKIFPVLLLPEMGCGDLAQHGKAPHFNFFFGHIITGFTIVCVEDVVKL